MDRKELISAVANLLRECDARKPVKIPEQVFTISDSDGNSKDFVVKQQKKNVLYTIDDVKNIIDACVEIIEENIKHGEDTTIHGFGTLGVHLRAARKVKRPDNGKWVEVKERYVPKFEFGNELRRAALAYGMSLAESHEENEEECEDDIEDGEY